MNDLHEPTPQFLDHLARETRRALRAGRRPTLGGGRAARALRAALLAAASLGAGAGLVLAGEHAQEARRVERALATNQVRLELAVRRAAALREAAERVRGQAQAGVVSAATLAEATARAAQAERTRAHAELEREELVAGGPGIAWAGATGLDARVVLDLTAPLRGARDFVSEHLRIEREALVAGEVARAGAVERARALFESGLVPSSELEHAEAQRAAARGELEQVDARLALRADFLLGRLAAEACARADLALDVRTRRAACAARLELLRRDLARAEQLQAQGRAGEPAALRLAAAEAEAELSLLDLELQALE